MLKYARRDLLRNPRRTLASLIGVVLGVGLFSGVLFFIDGSGASMTQRALAPVALDMQTVLTSPLGEGVRLFEHLSDEGPLKAGERTMVTLKVENRGAAAANEVLVNDQLTADLAYVRGSATRGGVPIPDVAGESPFAHGPAKIGKNIGTVAPGATVHLSYLVSARRSVTSAADLPLRATISSREDVAPNPANAPHLIPLAQMRDRITTIPSVATADSLAFAELPAGSLSSAGQAVGAPVKIFGFDQSYVDHHPSIRLASGSFDAGSAVLSPEASRALGDAGTGTTVTLTIPGAAHPVTLPVGGVADLSRARELFNSREGGKLEDFLYVPNSIVISPGLFRQVVVPAFRNATAARGKALKVKSPPTLEVDVQVDRAPLNADPAAALAQTGAIAGQIEKVAPEQNFLLDNVSNALVVAKADSAVAKRMFLFLGLPGLLLAAFLAAYAGSILAASQRREQANLRLRGAHRGHLGRILAYRTLALAGVGSLLGTLVGFASVLVVLGPSSLFEAAAGSLLLSALLAVGAGMLATGLALYVPGHRALRREVSGERREMALERAPAWRRFRLDYGAVLIALVATLIALRNGAFDSPVASVSTGQSAALSPSLLLLPLGAWFAGTLLSVRAFEGVARGLPVTTPPRFGPLVRGILGRSLSRRPRGLVTGIVGVGLVIAFGIGLAFFASTYDAAKQADSEFTVGSNLRITPSPISPKKHPQGFATDLEVSGVASATPVVATLENAFVKSTANSDVQNLAAIDPASFSDTAALSDQFFPGSTTAEAMAALEANSKGFLLDAETADGLKLEVGDQAEVALARGTKDQAVRMMTVVGLFDQFPGFPEGLNMVSNLDYYQSETGLSEVDFFLAQASDKSSAGLADAVSALYAGPGAADKLDISSTETTFNKDQSSLTALNIRGLVDLDSFFTLAISAAVIAIFVFGLMLQRRREYVTLRAQGMPSRKLQLLVFGEAAFVGISGLVAGLLVGSAMGLLLVHILQPLFILPPITTPPLGAAALLAALVLAATAASTLAALTILRRLSPSEVLREQ
ncbi:MAG: FtsX-like permease family protein [Solirubrobacterales bacterium]